MVFWFLLDLFNSYSSGCEDYEDNNLDSYNFYESKFIVYIFVKDVFSRVSIK